LTRFHYDRFDTPDDEENGKWAVNFRTNPQGDIGQAVMSLDEAEAVFVRRPDAIEPKLLTQLAGAYETPGGAKVHIAVAASGGLSLELPGQPVIPLTHVKALSFRTRQFSDLILEFMLKDEQVTGLQQRDPSGELRFRKSVRPCGGIERSQSSRSWNFFKEHGPSSKLAEFAVAPDSPVPNSAAFESIGAHAASLIEQHALAWLPSGGCPNRRDGSGDGRAPMHR
jgi:hypothetical protein